jgi:hypothetical protein
VGLSLSLLVSTLGLIVEGKTTCPTPEAVGSAMHSLLREEISGTDDRLLLKEGPEGLEVRLLDASGDQLASRRLPPAPGCAAQAHRVAVIAAAWQAELSEEPLPPEPGVKESPETLRSAQLWPVTPSPPPRTTPGYAVLGLRLSYASVGGLTTAFQLGGGASWRRWGFEGSGWAQWNRSYELVENGMRSQAEFLRVGGDLGPTFLARLEDPGVQLRAQGVAALLLANGNVDFDPGAQIGARVLVGSRPIAGFLDASLTLWPRLLSNVPLEPLSPLEFFLTFGLELGGA